MATVSDLWRTQLKRDRAQIGPLLVDRTTWSEVEGVLTRLVEDGETHQVATVNLQFLGEASRTPAFAKIVNKADLVVADGAPLLWLARLSGSPISNRITGHDLLQIVVNLACQQGYNIAFLGGAPGVADNAANHLMKIYPGLAPIKTYQGSFSPSGDYKSVQEKRTLEESLRASPPDFLFVALGCPKQEYWISRHGRRLDIPVCIGVGGILDVLSGRLKRAPLWMQRAGLEWSYRLRQEPRRLWKRYACQDVPTLSKLAMSAAFSRGSTWAGQRGRGVFKDSSD